MLDRRDFLARVAATGAAAALPLDAVAPLEAHRAPVGGAWDLSWTERLRGTSRAVFDSPGIEDGVALFRAMLWREQLHDVYGTAREDITPVIVLRHKAIVLAMDDEHWARMEVGKAEKVRTAAGKKWATRNPIASAAPGAKPPFDQYTLPAFIASGGVALAFGLAFQFVVNRYVEKDKLDHAAAEKAAREHLIPGVILQPSGFFAVLRAQEAGCHYMLGS